MNLSAFKFLFKPTCYGFVTGHWHIDDKKIEQFKDILYNPDCWPGVVSHYEDQFSRLIGDGYGVSFAAGRMAFYVMMGALDVRPGDEIILLGFTCSVMANAVCRIGATPVYTNVDPETFGSSPEAVEAAITSKTKLIVAQHSFGIPCKIDRIVEIAKEYGIFIVEDCAITLESTYKGKKVGTWGDAAIFSTDHSKPLNTVIGGFFYTKDHELYEKVLSIAKKLPHLSAAHQERLFDQFLFERKFNLPNRHAVSLFLTYSKLLKRKISGVKKFTFLEGDYTRESPATYPYPAKLPSFLAQIGLFELDRWKKEKERRKAILRTYLDIISESPMKQYVSDIYFDLDFEIVPLRFVFTHPEADQIKKVMEKLINVGWFWFRQPIICCPCGPEEFRYEWGSCSISEQMGKTIINWPCVVPQGWEEKLYRFFKSVVED